MMIWIVDSIGRIVVATADYIRTCEDRTLLELLVRGDWCGSAEQASELARLRRRRAAAANTNGGAPQT